MCLFTNQSTDKPKATIPPHEAAPPGEVGARRKQEDNALFGGVPKLRIDRAGTTPGIDAGGSGLNTMQ